jgi:hypothetical protein
VTCARYDIALISDLSRFHYISTTFMLTRSLMYSSLS